MNEMMNMESANIVGSTSDIEHASPTEADNDLNPSFLAFPPDESDYFVLLQELEHDNQKELVETRVRKLFGDDDVLDLSRALSERWSEQVAPHKVLESSLPDFEKEHARLEPICGGTDLPQFLLGGKTLVALVAHVNYAAAHRWLRVLCPDATDAEVEACVRQNKSQLSTLFRTKKNNCVLIAHVDSSWGHSTDNHPVFAPWKALGFRTNQATNRAGRQPKVMLYEAAIAYVHNEQRRKTFLGLSKQLRGEKEPRCKKQKKKH